MRAALLRPLSPARIAGLTLVVTLGTAAYCLAYSAFAGRPEPLGAALAWPIANILPWLAALEWGKRRGAVLLPVIAALAGSLLLGAAIDAFDGLGFEVTRRLPAAGVTVALLAVLARFRPADSGAAPAELPLPAARIAWVSAAGNYVELHGAGRPVLVRTPLSRIAELLAGHDFVRIHRSTLVNRSRIARVRPSDVVLDDGTSLKTGARYRAQLRG